MTQNKSKNPAFVIMKRELSAYFTSPIAYIVTGLYLIITGILFFSTFYLYNRAELRLLFTYLPLLLSFFVPALTMRVFAEEKRVGSIETLMTLPVTEVQVVTGKYLASFISTLIMIAPTLLYIIPAEVFGSPDYGPIVGGYLGAIFLCASYTAIGIFATSITKNQIIAFFTGFIICIALTMIDSFMIFLPAQIVSLFSYISANSHFNSIARGIIDTRDLIYFISLTALFFTITVKIEQTSKN
ncbi:MAG: ABC transporter permease [Treponema sp.]|nr:ABC transporter permease [Treponema sp.]